MAFYQMECVSFFKEVYCKKPRFSGKSCCKLFCPDAEPDNAVQENAQKSGVQT
jgi:hypothetical protein